MGLVKVAPIHVLVRAVMKLIINAPVVTYFPQGQVVQAMPNVVPISVKGHHQIEHVVDEKTVPRSA